MVNLGRVNVERRTETHRTGARGRSSGGPSRDSASHSEDQGVGAQYRKGVSLSAPNRLSFTDFISPLIIPVDGLQSVPSAHVLQ
jgi:hypothetical protein